jgi:hypothetical protein
MVLLYDIADHFGTCKDGKLVFLETGIRKGFYSEDVFACSGCGHPFVWKGGPITKSSFMKKKSPEINQLVVAAMASGPYMGFQCLKEFAMKTGIQMTKCETSLRQMEQAFNEKTIEYGKKVLNENALKEGEVTKAKPNYIGDTTDGKTIIGEYRDGNYDVRSYRKNFHKSSNAATLMVGKETKKPIALAVMSRTCDKCSHHSRKGQEPPKHFCVKNTDKSMGYSENEGSVICQNDLRQQNLEIKKDIADSDTGSAASLKSNSHPEVVLEVCPCCVHISKGFVRGFEKIKDQLNLAGVLTMPRIRMIASDMILAATNKKIDWEDHMNSNESDSLDIDSSNGNAENLMEELDQLSTSPTSATKSNMNADEQDMSMDEKIIQDRIANVIPHHCGEHSNCDENWCGFKWLENRSMDTKLHVPRGGCYLKVSGEIQKKLIDAVRRMTNKHVIKGLVAQENTNIVENVWSILVRNTGGKRVRLSGRATYTAKCYQATLRKSEGPSFSINLFNAMNLKVHPTHKQLAAMDTLKHERDRKRKSSNSYKDKRLAKKENITLAEQQAKMRGNKRGYSSGKYLPGAPVKLATSTHKHKNPRTMSKCSRCRQEGHTKKKCPFPEDLPRSVFENSEF